MAKLTLDLKYSQVEDQLESIKERTLEALDTLLTGAGPGNDFLGWVRLPENYDKEEFARIKKAAEKIRKTCDTFVMIGIGGSYLGARAVIEALTPKFKSAGIDIVYAGKDISPNETYEILEYLKDRDFAINVISKSGTTTEPAIAFRLIKELFDQKYSDEEAKDRLFVTTDKARGALKPLADAKGYETFVVPDDVGGRFSVLTAVGLLPIAVMGIDIDELMAGAQQGMDCYMVADFEQNDALRYAAARNLLYEAGKVNEILVNYEPKLIYISEWWKQLYGESEGKDGKGIFPASANFTTDLHSLGQIIQDGMANKMETVLSVDQPTFDITMKEDASDLDGLNFLAGKTLDYINKQAMEGTLQAHVEGGVPNMRISIDKLDAKNLGLMLYFFEVACGVSGYILGVNPFDQPGVELYKRNMFTLLGKPGY